MSKKTIQKLYASSIFVLNVICVFLLYTHYGPLTENGNRYYHSFDIQSMNWGLLGLCSLACIILLIPYFFFTKKECNRMLDIYPTRRKVGKIYSKVCAILNLGTGTLFTFSLVLITNAYLSNSSRVMAEDLETIMLGFAYFCCMIFWGIVDLIYFAFHYRR